MFFLITHDLMKEKIHLGNCKKSIKWIFNNICLRNLKKKSLFKRGRVHFTIII
jgi:hypothetical protein